MRGAVRTASQPGYGNTVANARVAVSRPGHVLCGRSGGSARTFLGIRGIWRIQGILGASSPQA
eukprot:10738719-Alexandrium_andersonii.AAC.1